MFPNESMKDVASVIRAECFRKIFIISSRILLSEFSVWITKNNKLEEQENDQRSNLQTGKQ